MPDSADMSEEEKLLRSVASMSNVNPARLDAQLRLQVLANRRQSETTEKLVTATANLVEVTKRQGEAAEKQAADLVAATRQLMHATWGLVGVTLALVAAEVFLRLFGKG